MSAEDQGHLLRFVTSCSRCDPIEINILTFVFYDFPYQATSAGIRSVEPDLLHSTSANVCRSSIRYDFVLKFIIY